MVAVVTGDLFEPMRGTFPQDGNFRKPRQNTQALPASPVLRPVGKGPERVLLVLAPDLSILGLIRWQWPMLHPANRLQLICSW